MSYKKYLEYLGKKKIVKKYANGGDTEDPIKPSRDWLSNWFKNRKTTDEEVNKFLEANRDEIIKRINNVSAEAYPTTIGGDGGVYMNKGKFVDLNNEDIVDLPQKNVVGFYSPTFNEISYLKALGGDSPVVKHELTHAGMNKLYNDYLKSINSQNISPINELSKDTKTLIYDRGQRNLKYLRDLAKEKDKEDKDKYLHYLERKGLSKEEISKKMSNYDDSSTSGGLEEIMALKPMEYLSTLAMARNPYLWKDQILSMDSPSPYDQSLLRQQNPMVSRSSFIENGMGSSRVLDYFNDYVSQPNEVHARIMEIRNALGVKPDQVIDKDFLDKNREKLNDNDAYLELRDLLKEGDNSLIDLMNRLAQNDKKSNRFSQYLNTIKNA